MTATSAYLNRPLRTLAETVEELCEIPEGLRREKSDSRAQEPLGRGPGAPPRRQDPSRGRGSPRQRHGETPSP